jgi:hypothetical protein
MVHRQAGRKRSPWPALSCLAAAISLVALVCWLHLASVLSLFDSPSSAWAWTALSVLVVVPLLPIPLVIGGRPGVAASRAVVLLCLLIVALGLGALELLAALRAGDGHWYYWGPGAFLENAAHAPWQLWEAVAVAYGLGGALLLALFVTAMIRTRATPGHRAARSVQDASV